MKRQSKDILAILIGSVFIFAGTHNVYVSVGVCLIALSLLRWHNEYKES